ncbi:hypothetical protein H6G93_18070 [Nostoc sp. FACHB-973]|nr:hypothetical protein [Nostoc sp. FACHB-973]
MSENKSGFIEELNQIKTTIERLEKIQNFSNEEYIELFQTTHLKILALKIALLEACALASNNNQQEAIELYERLEEQANMATKKHYYEFTQN